MGTRHLTLMGAAVLAVSVLGAGCSHKADTAGEGAARISAINLAYSDTTKVTVTIEADNSGAPGTGAAITRPIVVPLGQRTTGNNWSTTAQGIPSGRVKYTGNAYDATNTVIFTGSVLGVITAGNTASVTLNLFQATPNTFANNAPVISALQIGTTTATPNQVVAVNVVATDPDAGDTLTYAWTATCGTFAAAASASTTWTAPASSSAPCVLTVSVTDNHGASNTATASISVSASSKGGVAVTVAPDLAPIITGINVNVTNTATPPVAAAFVTGNIANLSVQATDDGTIASYLWSANAACTGAFSNVAIANPAFTVTAAAGVSCQFSIVVTDDKGQATTGTLVLPVVPTAGSAVAAPVVEIYSQSSDSIANNQSVYLYLAVDQIAGDVLDFTWTDNLDGGPGSSATVIGGISSSGAIIVTDPTVTQPNIQVKYVAPANLGTPSTPITFTVTVTDTTNHLAASHTFTITKANDPCANNAPATTSCDDGNACTQSDHCDGAGHCVGASPVVCTASDACHAVGTCNSATGTCSNPNAPSGTACSDGNACTQSDTCNGLGTCSGGAPVVCTATTCNVPGTCNTSTGACSAQTPAANGTACNDNNACTTVDTCQAGACVGGSPVSCPVATDACHVAGTCLPATGACSPQTIGNEGGACNDNSLCTSNDICTAGVCAGSPVCVAPLTCNPADGSCVAPACMQPTAARDWNVLTVYLASSGGAAPVEFSAGTTYASFDFGAGAKAEGGDSDVYVNGLNMATGVATWTRDLGDSSAQSGLGVAASSAMVGVIGNYLGSMTGTTLPSNSGATPIDFVVGLSPTDGTTQWGTKVDLGGGDFASITSNPTLGAFFVCGNFGVSTTVAGGAGAVDLVPGALAFGGKDIVVARINAATGAVVWARQIGDTHDDLCTAVVASDDGSKVYLTGTYSNDAVNFGLGAFPTASSSQARIFMAELNGTTGATIAATAFGTTGRQLPAALAVDSSGNVVLGGSFLTTIAFGTSTIVSAGNLDAFVAKFDSTLAPLWAHNWGDSQSQKIQTVATDSAGNIFAGGLFSGAMNIGAGGAAVTSAGNSDAFTIKLTAAGALVCGATYGDANAQETDTVTVARFATGTAMDSSMIGGAYAGQMTIGPVSLNTGSGATSHGFVASINANSF